MRDSKLFYERELFGSFYQQVVNLWETPKRIILTGNSVIGISTFQLYVLRRLLMEHEKTYRFVVQQIRWDFYLYDLESCQCWLLVGKDSHIVFLLDSLKNALYLFESGADTNPSPSSTRARSILFLPPCPERIHRYTKSNRIRFLYMPVWTLDELLVIAANETMDLDMVPRTILHVWWYYS
jgi:hypothetical protein